MEIVVPTSHIKILYYHFTPKEVQALYRLILYIGWISRKDEEINDVVNRICKIIESNELATKYHQTA